jgi:hypothetical protein
LSSACQAFRDQVEAQLSDAIISMMDMLGSIPDDDDNYLQAVETARKWVEEYKFWTQELTSGETKPHKTSIYKSTNKEKENKRENKKDYNKDENKKEVKNKKSEYKRFSSMKEAVNKISDELIQKHKGTKTTCSRCGRSKHYITEYYATLAKGSRSLEQLTVSSHGKRQRSDKEYDVAKENTYMKNAKIATVRLELEIAAERHIWDIDRDAEEDF